MKWLRDWGLSIAAGRVGKRIDELTADIKKLRASLKAANADIASLSAIIVERDADAADSSAIIQQLEFDNLSLQQKVDLRDDVIAELRSWIEEIQASRERSIALHERAKHLALNANGMQEPPQDEYLS